MLHSGRKVIVMAPFQIEQQNGQVNKKQRLFPRLRHCLQGWGAAGAGKGIKGVAGDWQLSIVARSRQHSIVDFVRLGRIVDFFIRIVSVCLHLPPICEKRFVAVLLLILLCQHLIVGNRCPGDHCGSADGSWKGRGEQLSWEGDNCPWSRFDYSAHVKIHFDCTHRILERSFKKNTLFTIYYKVVVVLLVLLSTFYGHCCRYISWGWACNWVALGVGLVSCSIAVCSNLCWNKFQIFLIYDRSCHTHVAECVYVSAL